MSTGNNKAAETGKDDRGLPKPGSGVFKNNLGVKRGVETQDDDSHELLPDPKRIREAVGAQTHFPSDEGPDKSKSSGSLIPPWTSKELKEGKRRRWPRPSEPIRNIDEVPGDWRWDPMDEDIDPSDIDAKIQRCKKRIKDKIMPQVFETRLSTYRMLKEHQDNLIYSEKRGLSLDVVKRLDYLRAIQKNLEENGDAFDELPNVTAIMAAYRSKRLKWSNDGEATYWFQGKQLCEPKKWSYHDITKAFQEAKGTTGFWVEGIDGPGPTGVFFAWSWAPNPNNLTFQHNIKFELRVPPIIGGSTRAKLMANFRPPGSLGWRENFLDDTGSDVVTIFDDDLNEILNLAPSGTQVPTIGVFALHTAGGKSNVHRNIVLQARVLGPAEQPITNFYPVRVAVWSSSYKVDVPVRLSGNWWRHVLYVASAPTNKGRLYASTMKHDLCKMLPDVDFQRAQEPSKAHTGQSGQSGLSDETGRPDWLKRPGGRSSGFYTGLGYGWAGTPMRPPPTQPGGQASEINPVPPGRLREPGSEFSTQMYPFPVPSAPSSAAPSRAASLRSHSSVASGRHPSPYQGQTPGLTEGWAPSEASGLSPSQKRAQTEGQTEPGKTRRPKAKSREPQRAKPPGQIQAAFSPETIAFEPALRLDPKASTFAPVLEKPPSNPARSPIQPEHTGVSAEMQRLALESEKRARALSGLSEWSDQGVDPSVPTRSPSEPADSETGQTEGPAHPQQPKATRRLRRNKMVQIEE